MKLQQQQHEDGKLSKIRVLEFLGQKGLKMGQE